MAVLSDAQKAQQAQGLSWSSVYANPIYKSLIDSGVLKNSGTTDESVATIDPSKPLSTTPAVDPMKLTSDQYRHLITTTGPGINWDQAAQDPLLKTLMDEGVLNKTTGISDETPTARLDWSQLPPVTGGLNQSQLDIIHGNQMGFNTVDSDTSNLKNPGMIFKDPIYGNLTLSSNVSQPTEGGFWKYAPYIVQAIAAVATDGASLSLTAGQTLAEQLPNLARMLSDWQAAQAKGS